MADNKVNFLRGTSAEYATVTKDNDTFYYTTDNGKLYLGNKEITSAGVTEEQLVNALAEHNISTDAHAALFQGGETVEKASAYTLDNAVDYPIVDMRIYGKSTQDGTPTPDAPVDIVSVGDSGAVSVTACGKNLLDLSVLPDSTVNGVTFKKNNDGSFTVSGGKTEDISFTLTRITLSHEQSLKIFNSPGDYILSGVPYCEGRLEFIVNWFSNGNMTSGYLSSWEEGANLKNIPESRFSDDFYVAIAIYITNGYDVLTGTFFPQIEKGSTATDYEPYVGSTATLTSALPLCGIPVDNGGNYTDSTGQQWIADEVVYNADGTGKIIKNTIEMIFDGSEDEGWENWETKSTETSNKYYFHIKLFGELSPIVDSEKYTGDSPSMCICNKYQTVSGAQTWKESSGISAYHYSTSLAGLNIYDEERALYTLNEWKAWLADNPITVVYALNTPQEISLTAAEMAQLEALQTFDGVTNISNDGGAEMSVKYCTNKALSEYVNPIIEELAENTAAKNHTHTVSDISDFPGALPADGGNADTVGHVAVSSSNEVGLRKISAGTDDLTAGTSALETGAIYLVYE